MSLVVIGINHKKAPLEVRERFSFRDENLDTHYRALKNHPAVREAFILSTCNRVELYGVGDDPAIVADNLKKFLGQAQELPVDFLEKYFYTKIDREATTHLLRVAGGLDSMVLGEVQIMGQIRKAYISACVSGGVGTSLHKVIQDALRIGKKVRNLTGISRGVTSIPGVVMELIKKESGLAHKKALVIGAGKVGAGTVAKLAGLLLQEITVINRDKTVVDELTKKLKVRAADIRMLPQEIFRADIIIAATAAPHIINCAMLEGVLHIGKRQLLLIDLGVPRNIEEAARNIPMLRLYNIDDLAPFIKESMRNRSLEALKAEEIIRSESMLLAEGAVDYKVMKSLCAR
ncbi:MAG: glutamyl-tRNA reductase [Candidatus Omnitrophica bacterium]|nr:glutamyl-tRNA reductase [Candidatus Omnitrophota bacterium]MBU4468207.1 glutamyl-tRNA reductase [Candidatus Omnitrophota bacterium]MCG2708294.1 glutamyl-tRNA reductase [Candidatus Omnitrophota bacterium]